MVHLDRQPFLVETSRPGVFAVGDVRSGSTRMVAPAVGEGGMAVRFVAEHLARSARPRGVHLIEPSRRLVSGDTADYRRAGAPRADQQGESFADG
jgi:hypothetical protein